MRGRWGRQVWETEAPSVNQPPSRPGGYKPVRPEWVMAGTKPPAWGGTLGATTYGWSRAEMQIPGPCHQEATSGRCARGKGGDRPEAVSAPPQHLPPRCGWAPALVWGCRGSPCGARSQPSCDLILGSWPPVCCPRDPTQRPQTGRPLQGGPEPGEDSQGARQREP